MKAGSEETDTVHATLPSTADAVRHPV